MEFLFKSDARIALIEWGRNQPGKV